MRVALSTQVRLLFPGTWTRYRNNRKVLVGSSSGLCTLGSPLSPSATWVVTCHLSELGYYMELKMVFPRRQGGMHEWWEQENIEWKAS